jgi:D-glycero-alpha-D-manno-heptose-7-phosphate kinase
MEKIVITRAPVRISLGGGGTDLPSYYERYGGLTISATISYYVYTILSPSPVRGIQVIYADHRLAAQDSGYKDLIWYGDLSLPKAITHHFNIRDGLSVFLASQVPPTAGLGVSGSVTVSMIKALAFCCGLDLGPREVAELACYIELEKMGMPVGKQDPYAAAFGGLNRIVLSREGVTVEPLHILPQARDELNQRLMLFYLGVSHQSSSILYRQREANQSGDRAMIGRLKAIKEMSREMSAALEKGDLDAFGRCLHRTWMEKRDLVEGITNPSLDRYYQAARENGALGGTMTGAGGGGFLLLYCPTERQKGVQDALAALGAQRWPFALEDEGVQVMQVVPWSRQPVAPAMSWAQPSLPRDSLVAERAG